MVSKEDLSMTAFEIVAYAGDAKSALLKSIENARKGEFEQSRLLLKEAREAVNDAHKSQTKILSQEAGGQDLEVTFIMVHAQDSLMTTMMLMEQAEFFIDSYERLYNLENH